MDTYYLISSKLHDKVIAAGVGESLQAGMLDVVNRMLEPELEFDGSESPS